MNIANDVTELVGEPHSKTGYFGCLSSLSAYLIVQLKLIPFCIPEGRTPMVYLNKVTAGAGAKASIHLLPPSTSNNMIGHDLEMHLFTILIQVCCKLEIMEPCCSVKDRRVRRAGYPTG